MSFPSLKVQLSILLLSFLMFKVVWYSLWNGSVACYDPGRRLHPIVWSCFSKSWIFSFIRESKGLLQMNDPLLLMSQALDWRDLNNVAVIADWSTDTVTVRSWSDFHLTQHLHWCVPILLEKDCARFHTSPKNDLHPSYDMSPCLSIPWCVLLCQDYSLDSTLIVLHLKWCLFLFLCHCFGCPSSEHCS